MALPRHLSWLGCNVFWGAAKVSEDHLAFMGLTSISGRCFPLSVMVRSAFKAARGPPTCPYRACLKLVLRSDCSSHRQFSWSVMLRGDMRWVSQGVRSTLRAGPAWRELWDLLLLVVMLIGVCLMDT